MSIPDLAAMDEELFAELDVYATAQAQEKERRQRVETARQHRTGKGGR